ncbi:MAG: hypothetical protein RI568_13680 [Natronomonas sp.]|uniref:hypothetical protein n=1 Tax=Natronomonas sp. TaxID=2184060 RepID=UPI0028708547|nr:hypothetical protein [Natronomonas sp.]MDR9431733.1 hypothetical protein [Natronomonas sp.]
MPVFEKTHGSEVLLRGVDRRVTVGDRVDVTDEYADYLSNRADFELLDVHDAEFREIEEDDGDADDEGGFDAAEFIDRTPVDDVVDDIEAGEADEHLDAVAEAGDRVSVEDAVGQRRAELEE